MEWLLISWPTLILLGLALRMALRLHYGARGPEPGDAVYAFLNTNSWVLLVLGLVPAIVAGVMSLFGLIVLGLAAVAVVEVVVGRRAAQRRSTCTLLALLAERREQLDSSVVLAGRSMRGFVGRATRRLFQALGGGTPLAEAIRRFPRALPREALAYAAAGETMQAEAAALKELSRSDQHELTSIWRACVDRISYLACVLIFMSGVMVFLMIKIIPEYRKIFYEFDLELPLITEIAVRFSAFNIQNEILYLLFVLFMFAVIVALFVVGVFYLLDFPVLQPLTDRMFRGRRVGDVLRVLAVATEYRQPLAGVLARLARDFPSDVIRRQLRTAADAVAAGGVWRDALRDARLVTPAEHGLLKTAEQVGNLPWALRAIAMRNQRRGIYRLSAAIQVLYPCVILLLGALVAFFVVALFIPIVQLISGLTS